MDDPGLVLIDLVIFTLLNGVVDRGDLVLESAHSIVEGVRLLTGQVVLHGRDRLGERGSLNVVQGLL